MLVVLALLHLKEKWRFRRKAGQIGRDLTEDSIVLALFDRAARLLRPWRKTSMANHDDIFNNLSIAENGPASDKYFESDPGPFSCSEPFVLPPSYASGYSRKQPNLDSSAFSGGSRVSRPSRSPITDQARPMPSHTYANGGHSSEVPHPPVVVMPGLGHSNFLPVLPSTAAVLPPTPIIVQY